MPPKAKAADEAPVKAFIPSLAPKKDDSKRLAPTTLLKESYASASELLQALEANADALLAESAAIYLDGRILFPLNEDGTTIEFGRVWNKREERFILADVGASAYVTGKDGKVTR